MVIHLCTTRHRQEAPVNGAMVNPKTDKAKRAYNADFLIRREKSRRFYKTVQNKKYADMCKKIFEDKMSSSTYQDEPNKL